MTLGDRIRLLESHSLFKTLSYKDQSELRARAFEKDIHTVPSFQNLTTENQLEFYNSVVFRPPVFEGSLIENSSYQRVANDLASDSPERQQFALDRMHDQVLKGAMVENITLMNLTAGLLFSGVGLLTGEDVSSDHAKMVEYFDFKLQTDKRSNSTIEWGKNIIGGLSFLADTASLYSTFVGSFQKPAGIVKPLMNVVGDLQKIGVPDLALKGLRAFYHSFGGGVVGVIRETMKDWALSRNGFQDPNVRDVAFSMGNYFKDYFIGDFLFFGAAGVLKKFTPWATQPFTRNSQFLKKFNLFRGLEDDVVSGLLRPKNAQQKMQLLTDALSGNVPKGIYQNLDDVSKGVVDAMQSAGKIRDISKVTSDDMLKIIAQSQGYSVLEEGGNWKLFNIADDGKLMGTFNDSLSLTQKLSDDILSGKEIPLTSKEFQTIGAGMQRVELKETISANLKGELENTPELLTKIIAPIGGKLEPTQVGGFAKAYLIGNNVDDALVSSVRSMPTENGIKLFVGADEIAEVPKVISSPLIEREAIENIVDGLGKFLPEEVIGDVNKVRNFISQYEVSLKKQQLFTPDWVDMAVKEQWDGVVNKVDDNLYEIVSPMGRKEFSSIDEIGDALVRESTTVETLRQHLQQYEGVQLNSLADNQLELIKPGSKPQRFENLNDLLNSNPELTPKISSNLGPELTIVDSTITGIKYQGKALTGDYQGILRELDKFKDYSNVGSKVRIYSGKDGILDVNRYANEFTVRLNDLNYEKTFKSKSEAMKFLKEGVNSFAEISQIAMEKGLILDTQGSKLVLYDQSRQFLYDSIEELKNGLSTLAPSPSYIPELTGMDSKIFDNLEKPLDFNFPPKDYMTEPKGKLGPIWYINNMFSPPDRQFVTAVKKGVAPPDLVSMYNNVENAIRLKTSQDFSLLGAADAIFTDPSTGKAMKDGLVGTIFESKWQKVREDIGKFLEVPTDEWGKLAENLDLDPKYLEVAKDLRNTWDELAKFYDVPAEKQIVNYLPRLRKFSNEIDMAKYLDSDTAKFIDNAFNNNAPKRLHAFFDNSRVSDFVAFIREKDPMVLLTKYIMAGNRKKFLGPSIGNAREWLGKNWNNMKEGAATRFAYFLDEVAGIPHATYNMDNIRKAGEELLNTLPFLSKNPKAKGDFTSKLFSLAYMSTMAWRPALMTRNSHQIFTTLASRVGFNTVDNAMMRLAEDSSQEIYKRLKALGVLQIDLPLPGGQWMRDGGKLTKIATIGLQGYRNSDELTRAIAYLASEDMFEKAFQQFQSGKMTLKQFSKKSGMTLMDDVTFDEIGKLLNNNEYQGALNKFASTMVRDTMFPYIQGMGGTLSKQSVIGKIFGAFGHYPAWYRANIRRGLTQGTTSQKIGFATRWIGGGLAMAGVYGAIGVGASNFIPWSPMFFNGGPYYDLVNTLLEMPKSERARSEIFGDIVGMRNDKPYIDPTRFLESKLVRSFFPTTYQLRALGRGVQYLNDGEMWKAFVALTSAPVIEADPFANYRRDFIIGGLFD